MTWAKTAKYFGFRIAALGLDVDDPQSLSAEIIAGYAEAVQIPQRPLSEELYMGRSTRKGPFIDETLMRKVQVAQQTRDRKPIKTWSRRSTISPDFVGANLLVHNGKGFLPVFVSENMVGHKLGEFAPTRIFRKHGGVKKEKGPTTGLGK